MRFLLLLCLTFGVVNAGEFAPAFHEPDVFKSRQIRAQVERAHSNPYYQNVGQLKWRSPCDWYESRSNAIYISDRLCITAAHCVYEGCPGEVTFTTHKGEKITRNIKKSILFPDYVRECGKTHHAYINFHKNFQYDIAVLILEKGVEEFKELPIGKFVQSNPVYAFAKELNNLAEPLYVVGYVRDLMWEKALHSRYADVKKSFCFYECARSHNVMLSYPYGHSYYYADVRSAVYQRPFFPAEGIVAPGLSGSALFHPTFGLVGITCGLREPPDSVLASDRVCIDRCIFWGYNITFIKACGVFFVMCIGYSVIPIYFLMYSLMHSLKIEHYLPNHTWFTKPPRISALALMVGGYADWIDKIRREEIGSDV